MAQLGQRRWDEVLVDARSFLGRWGDAFTCSERDDLAQDAVVAAWQSEHTPSDPRRIGAFVRTITRRKRVRALVLARRCAVVADGDLGDWPAPTSQGPTPCLRVDGALVPADWLLDQLRAVLARIRPENRDLLLGFYAGRSCGDLARQSGLSEQAVKVRLHRSRTNLRKRLEAATRAAGHFEA